MVQRTVGVDFLLCGCETWSRTFREEYRLKMFQSRVWSNILGPKMESNETGENGMTNLIICIPQQILFA